MTLWGSGTALVNVDRIVQLDIEAGDAIVDKPDKKGGKQ